LSIIDHGVGADCADTANEETVGKGGAGSADTCGIEGESLLADTTAAYLFLVGSAGTATRPISSRIRSSRTDLTSPIDSS
jgi:hypothetical protein